MANEVDSACKQMIQYVRTLRGIREAPDYAPEEIGNYPFALAYPGGGVMDFGPANDRKGLHTLTLELHIARKDLSNDVKKAAPFVDSIPNLLMYKLQNDNQWNGTISTFQRISYTFGSLGWNQIETFGVRFRVEEVKIQTAITAPA